MQGRDPFENYRLYSEFGLSRPFTAHPGLEEDPIAGLKDQAIHMFPGSSAPGWRCAIGARRNPECWFPFHGAFHS